MSYEPTSEADLAFRAWMHDNLTRAANHFAVTVDGDAHLGWLDRSISAPVSRDGRRLWLRVVSEDPQWVHLDFWTGNREAAVIAGIDKPVVLDSTEWDEHRRQRAELMTRLPGTPCSPTDVLRTPVQLSDQWWRDLRRALRIVAATATTRTRIDQEKFDDRVQGVFGPDCRIRIESWTTAHGDLHWANLMRPDFGMLDWEMWGRAPAGTDAATLYCFSLLEPATAAKVRDLFADQLDTPDGWVALLYVIARLLRRVEGGEFADLREPLERLAATTMTALGR